ncbi:MAG: hypothetical protein A3J66_01060 [Candidatus Magasanikbacteria bacterium RIFCSPHIGHO2_02_FULL_47_14]|uniref:Addiction module toxin, HicA family n=1 Tax=Candidatus Magasanikbacteria bacterium RIFCSPHIGHO2_02_FULL_47_14 TaxID=1798680 RepID=A0A1F6M2X9_9BACT|nr:MAG: hypothetical protein A3J66_01060 [Candidatus Magasanikbacteria bacterium RIFCSPHIGHO2_02_FULL_47_14]
MSPYLPILKARDMIRILRDLGFISTGYKGSHERFAHPDGRSTEVPHHGGTDIGRRLLQDILREIKMSPQEFRKLLS